MSEPTMTVTVAGMTCEGCAGKVRAAVEAVDGVSGASIDVATGAVDLTLDGSVSSDDLSFALDEAVHAAGYRVV